MPKSYVISLNNKKTKMFWKQLMIYCWFFKIKIVYTRNIRQNPNSIVIKCIFFLFTELQPGNSDSTNWFDTIASR